MRTQRLDREMARRELLAALERLSDQPAPKLAAERAAHMGECENIGSALVSYFTAERIAFLGDARLRARYLRQLADLLDMPPAPFEGGEARDRSRLVSFRLLLSSACMHLTTQAQREAARESGSMALPHNGEER